jgi:hypothetical protein
LVPCPDEDGSRVRKRPVKRNPHHFFASAAADRLFSIRKL